MRGLRQYARAVGKILRYLCGEPWYPKAISEKEVESNLTCGLKVTNVMPRTTGSNARVRAKTNYDTETLEKAIQQLDRENEALRNELWKFKRKPSGKIGYIFLFSGSITLVLSIVYTSLIAAFIGISLTFWGALLLFITPAKYVKASLLRSTAISTFTNINELITNMNYKGRGIYLPPQYSKDAKDGKVFVPTKDEITIPPIEKLAQEKVFLENPEGICLTPLGLALTNTFEDELLVDFAEADLEFMQENLPKLFVEDLEIAEDFEMSVEGNVIQLEITGSIFKDFCKEGRRLSNMCNALGCPLCSSIACALTRATGKPVIIENILHSEDDETIQVKYRILGPTKGEVSAPSSTTTRQITYLPPGLVGLIPAALGSIILAWVGWLTWHDITTWSKSLTLIFFGSRAGEVVSLGIDLRAIHYLLIGLALFLAGIVVFFRRRRHMHVEE